MALHAAHKSPVQRCKSQRAVEDVLSTASRNGGVGGVLMLLAALFHAACHIGASKQLCLSHHHLGRSGL